MTESTHYYIGTPGQPWGAAERAAWLASRVRRRSYAQVLNAIDALRSRFDVLQYGTLDCAVDSYPLLAIKSRNWRDDLPCALVTGGVHGYETSGVLGALRFVETFADAYRHRVNLVVAPCVSPWAWERVERWNPQAIDPNRSFLANCPAPESAALMALLAPYDGRFLVHIDLHETTDSDESEFRRSLAARNGQLSEPGEVPDGFYLCGDSVDPQPEFQQAIIAAVSAVTHIAPADSNGQIIGSPVVAHGVINYPYRQLGLCAGATTARFRTTTEVYPDSPHATPEQCNAAQVAAVCAALDFALSHEPSHS